MKTHLSAREIFSGINENLKFWTTILLFLSFIFSVSAQTIRYVKEGAPSYNYYYNGSSWQRAAGDIREVIIASSPGDEVWVMQGTYVGNPTLTLREGVKIYGGFKGDETSLSQRDYITNSTILKGSSNYPAIVNNSSLLTNSTVVDGFTFKETEVGIQNMRNEAITIKNCIFEGAQIINLDQSSPLIENCSFTGMVGKPAINNMNSSSPVIRGCSFINNTTSAYGAIYIQSGTQPLNIENCLFYNNSSPTAGHGGAINSSVPLNITNSTFYGNSGPGITFPSSGTTITNSIIWNNSSSNISLGATVSHSNINLSSGVYSGTGNVNSDPLFVNPSNPAGADGIWGTADDGLKLTFFSPSINVGNNSAVPSTITNDIAGNSRIQMNTVDMGAYETSLTDCNVPAGSSIYVDESMPASINGSSWATAFKTLSEAIEVATSCTGIKNIYIAKGTYYPTGNQNGIDRNITFLIPQRGGIEIYGGYPNGGGTRDIKANPTILSGEIGNPNSISDNSYHVMVMTGTLSGAEQVVIDGVTITGGNANGTQFTYNGKLTNQNEGGGLLLRENFSIGEKIIVRNCTITKNKAAAAGGLYMWSSSALVHNTIISENSATNGGGVFIFDTQAPKIINSVIRDNTATNGGGIYNFGATTRLNIINSTLVENTSSSNGDNIYNHSAGTMNIVNSIVWNSNAAKNILNQSTLNASYSNILQTNGVYSGTGNINEEPIFKNAEEKDYQLLSCSPGINLGNNSNIESAPNGSGTLDILGNPRKYGTSVDMGAYELQANAGQNPFTIPTPESKNMCIGSTVQGVSLTGQNGQVCTIIDENSTQTISAPAGAIFNQVIFASYGNASGNCTTGFTMGSCNAANTRGIIESLALGNNSFSITPNYETFGDPCSGVAKKLYLTLTYTIPDHISENQYSWTNDNPAIGLSASGTGDIPSFEVLAAGVANITVIASKDACSVAAPVTFTYTAQEIPSLYVDASVSVSGDGKSWGTAFKTLQQALNAVPLQFCKPDSILVAKGTYIPANNQSFSMIEGVKILGGYPNGGGERNVVNNPTILQGSDRSVIRNDNNGLTHVAVLDGFTINRGRPVGSGAGQLNNGLGIYNRLVSPTISNCTFTNNDTSIANAQGGAIYNYGSSAVIKNCTFSGNDSYDGGAIYNDSSSTIISDCTFTNNSAANHGGAIYNSGGNPVILNSIFVENKGTWRSGSRGGAIYNSSSSPVIINNIFRKNESADGGAIFNTEGGTIVIKNSLFTENQVNAYGGAIHNYQSSQIIINSTFYQNTTSSNNGSATIYNRQSSSPSNLNIVNSIIWNSGAHGINNNGTINISYSNIKGGYTGTGNINTDTKFINPSNPLGNDNIWGTDDDGLSLEPCSSLGDLGDNQSYINAGGLLNEDFDLSGNNRLLGNSIAMGAYEPNLEDCIIKWIGSPQAGYWSNGSGPVLEDDAFVEGDLIISNQIQAKDFQVLEGGTVTIQDGGSLTLTGKITNQNTDDLETPEVNEQAEAFIVKSGGNLIQNTNYNTDDNEGKIVLERESRDIVRLDYTLWSSPTREQQIQSFSPMTLPNRIYTYETNASNQSTNGAYVIVPNVNQNFSPGKGYLVRAPNDWNETHNNQEAPYLGRFIGTPFNGNLNVSTYPNGFTSLGNPYPSSIDPRNLITLNPGIQTIYFWNSPDRIFNSSTGLWEYTGTYYITCSAIGFSDPQFEGMSIAPGQGFIVRSTSPSVNFNNSLRTNSNEMFFRSGSDDRHRIWLMLSDMHDKQYNQILIGYMNGATEGADDQLDAEFFGYTGSAFYNLIGDGKYTLQARELPFNRKDVVRLGFRAESENRFKISLSHFDGLFAEGNVNVYLKDKLSNEVHNLMESDYHFKSKEGVYHDRFEIVYQKKTQDHTINAMSIANRIDVYRANKHTVVNSKLEKIVSIEIHNHHGKLVHENKKVDSKTYKILNSLFDKGILFLTIKTESGELVSKKVINN